jgi:hypothetical protein
MAEKWRFRRMTLSRFSTAGHSVGRLAGFQISTAGRIWASDEVSRYHPLTHPAPMAPRAFMEGPSASTFFSNDYSQRPKLVQIL